MKVNLRGRYRGMQDSRLIELYTGELKLSQLDLLQRKRLLNWLALGQRTFKSGDACEAYVYLIDHFKLPSLTMTMKHRHWSLDFNQETLGLLPSNLRNDKALLDEMKKVAMMAFHVLGAKFHERQIFGHGNMRTNFWLRGSFDDAVENVAVFKTLPQHIYERIGYDPEQDAKRLQAIEVVKREFGD